MSAPQGWSARAKSLLDDANALHAGIHGERYSVFRDALHGWRAYDNHKQRMVGIGHNPDDLAARVLTSARLSANNRNQLKTAHSRAFHASDELWARVQAAGTPSDVIRSALEAYLPAREG